MQDEVTFLEDRSVRIKAILSNTQAAKASLVAAKERLLPDQGLIQDLKRLDHVFKKLDEFEVPLRGLVPKIEEGIRMRGGNP